MTELTDDELLNIWRINFAKTNKLFLDIARAAIAADRDLTATLDEPADAPAAGAERPSDEELRDLWSWAAGQDQGPWPTQQHAFARAVLARWGQPPASPAEGEVAEMVAWLKENAEYSDYQADPEDAVMFRRTAELLERHAAVENLAADAVSGLRYIEQSAGRLYGVGWDRVFDAAATLQPAHALPLPAPQGGEVEP